MQELDLIKVILALAFFSFASYSDWKTRRVKDIVWIALGTIAIIILLIELFIRGAYLIDISLVLPLAFVFYDIFWDREHGLSTKTGAVAIFLYVISAIWVVYVTLFAPIYGDYSYGTMKNVLLIVFVTIAFFEILYIFDVLKGGADAKAMICLAILFSWYPVLSPSMPLIQPTIDSMMIFFPFALSVLFVAALISILIPIYFLIKNAFGGKKISFRSLVGFTIPITEVEKQFVWLIEWVEDGKPRFNSRKPRTSETLNADLAALQALGIKEVWVTYKIPFIIPLTIAIAFVIIIGNPLFALY